MQLSPLARGGAPLPGGGVVINDAYNANPISMDAALRHLAERGAGRRPSRSSAGWPSSATTPSAITRVGELRPSSGSRCSRSASWRAATGPTRGRRRRRRARAARELVQPGDAVLVKASRSVALEGIAPGAGEGSPRNGRVLIAGLIAMVISIVVGPRFIEFLRRNELGQQIREEGPAGHVVKQGTPTMGGLLILLCAPLPFLALSKYTPPALTVLFCGRLRRDRLPRRLHQAPPPPLARAQGPLEAALLAAITVVVGVRRPRADHSTRRSTSRSSSRLPLSCAWYPFLFLVIAGAANGVNLTDGLDGLAAGTGIIAMLTFTAMTVIGYIRSGDAGRALEFQLDLAILAAALIGAAIGFLWYNAFPAEVFMGDTGSMAIGGALAGFAIITRTEVLLS